MNNQEFAEKLTDKEVATAMMEYFVESAYKDLGENDDRGYVEVIKQLYRSNLDRIFEYSGSVIETVFLNSLVLGFIKCSPNCLFVTRPFKKGPEELKRKRAWVKDFIKSYEDVKKRMIASGVKDEISAFKKHIDRHFSEGIIDEEEKEFWQTQTFMHQAFDVNNSFHFTLQPSFPDFKPEGKRGIRPDLMIWIPNKPKFNLIVECDGYEWHADKTTFDKDRRRDRYLKKKGFDVLRYSGREIMNDPVGASTNLLEHLEIINPNSFK